MEPPCLKMNAEFQVRVTNLKFSVILFWGLGVRHYNGLNSGPHTC
jgi:hypothetical protein